MNQPMNSTTNPGQTRRNQRAKTLPRIRSKRSIVLIYLMSFIFLAVSVIFDQSDFVWTDTIFNTVSVLISSIFFLEVAIRLIHILEERQHLITRYDNSYATFFQDIFYFPVSTIIIVVCSVFTCIITYLRFGQWPHKIWYDTGLYSIIFSLIAAFFFQRNVNLKCGPLYDSLQINNSKGLDYGSGMAHSFFHGYLKLIIPKTGTRDTYLEELMKDYEDEHGVRLEFYKIFILIPKSLRCPTSLKDDEISPSIEESSSLQPKQMTRAGVQNRIYKNSVYKINSNTGRKIYVCAEYATPLKTLEDVVSYNGEHSCNYKKYKNDIVLQFYLTLKKVLNEHENCTNFCEPIFYDDKDENGRYKDVGHVLLQRIKKLKSKK